MRCAGTQSTLVGLISVHPLRVARIPRRTCHNRAPRKSKRRLRCQTTLPVGVWRLSGRTIVTRLCPACGKHRVLPSLRVHSGCRCHRSRRKDYFRQVPRRPEDCRPVPMHCRTCRFRRGFQPSEWLADSKLRQLMCRYRPHRHCRIVWMELGWDPLRVHPRLRYLLKR